MNKVHPMIDKNNKSRNLIDIIILYFSGQEVQYWSDMNNCYCTIALNEPVEFLNYVLSDCGLSKVWRKKPDLFEQWWLKNCKDNYNEETKKLAKQVWNSAIEYKNNDS